MIDGLNPVAQILTGAPAGVESDEPTDEHEDAPSSEPGAEHEDAPAAENDDAENEPLEEAKPLSVKELAAQLETTAGELYSTLQIDVGGESMSLGSFKDRAKDLVKADKMLADAQEHSLASSNEVLRQNRAINLAMQKLGRPLTQADLQEAEDQQAAYIKQENQLALAAIPEWSEKGVQSADMGVMGKMLTAYGMRPQEISMIADHRLVKLFRDYALQSERLKAAGKSVVPKKLNQGGKQRRKSAPTKKSAVDRVHSGELSQQQGVLTAIADGARK